MALVRVNHDSCLKALKAAQKHFQCSSAPVRLKKLARTITPIVFITHTKQKDEWLASAFGMSVRVRDKYRTKLQLKESEYPSTDIGGRRYYLLIEVFPKAFSKLQIVSWRYLKRVMAHEIAHLLHSCTEKQGGNFTVSNPVTDHDAQWQKISRWYGGNDSPFIGYCL